MSAKTNSAAKDVKFEADAREQMLPSINIFAEAAKESLDTEPNVAERLQFERGYN